MEPITILAALVPVLGDALKAGVSRWIAPDVFKPANVGEFLQMRESDISLYKAMNDTGAGQSFPWVEAIIKLQRPAVAATALIVWAYAHTVPGVGETGAIDNFAAAVGFYLFGDRTLFYSRKAAKVQ